MKVREWKSMTLAEQTAWYGQARHGDVVYATQAALCATEGHRPLTIWSFVGRVLCGGCGRTFGVGQVPEPADGLASALRTAAA